MKAVLYPQPGQITTTEVPTPKPAPGEVLIKVEACVVGDNCLDCYTSWDGGADHCQPRLATELRQLAGQTLLSLDFSDTREGWALFTRVGRHLNYSFFSRAEHDEAGIRAFLARAATFTSGTVIVTRGARGSMASDGRSAVTQPALPVRLVDTLGAGDAFIAGFLASIAKGNSVKSALRSGAAVAARVCEHLGAWQPSHRRAEIQETES